MEKDARTVQAEKRKENQKFKRPKRKISEIGPHPLCFRSIRQTPVFQIDLGEIP